MRVLLTAELGWNHRWFKWLDEGSKDYDLVSIAGDFINVFRPEPLNTQILKAKAFLRSLARKTRVVISSGNNDTVDEVDSSSRGPVPMWMAALDSINTLVSDGRTSVVRQQLIVTTLSYISTIDRKRSWLAEGADLRKGTACRGSLSIIIRRHSTEVRARKNYRLANYLKSSNPPFGWPVAFLITRTREVSLGCRRSIGLSCSTFAKGRSRPCFGKQRFLTTSFSISKAER